jgi:hypothetical protein
VFNSNGISNPLLPGCFRIWDDNLESALKTLFRSGREENLLVAHRIGLNNNMRNSFLIPAQFKDLRID